MKEFIENLFAGSNAGYRKFVESYGDELANANTQEAYTKAVEQVYSLFTGRDFDGNKVQVNYTNAPKIFGRTSEANLAPNDIPVLVQDAVTRIFQEPSEPNLFLQNVVAEPLELNALTKNVEFLTFNALVALPVGVDGEYQKASPALKTDIVNLKLNKYGLIVGMTEDMISQSNYNLIALHMRMLRKAVDRAKENLLKQTMDGAAQEIFNNSSSSSAFYTRGKDTDGSTANYTWSWRDTIDMQAALMNVGFTPTHLLYSPLAWRIFSTDPRLMYRRLESNASDTMETTAALPFGDGLQYVSYYGMDWSLGTLSTSAPGSSLPSTILANLIILDKSNALYLGTGGPASIDDFDDWLRDGKLLKVKQAFDAAAKDGGRAMVKASNIRVEENFEPLYSIQTV